MKTLQHTSSAILLQGGRHRTLPAPGPVRPARCGLSRNVGVTAFSAPQVLLASSIGTYMVKKDWREGRCPCGLDQRFSPWNSPETPWPATTSNTLQAPARPPTAPEAIYEK